MKELYLPYQGRIQFESRYGYRELNGATDWHNGIDLVGLDSKIILAPCDGEVKTSTIILDKTNKTWEWGNYVRIDYDLNCSVFLCHMSERFVQTGERVYRGQPIGIEGNTGYSFGSHCHFEVRKYGNPVNPCPLLEIYNGYAILNGEEDEKPLGHEWSSMAIKWAIKNEILKGYSDKEQDFKLDKAITREEMLVFLYRFYENCI